MDWTPELESLQNLANILCLSNRTNSEMVHNTYNVQFPGLCDV